MNPHTTTLFKIKREIDERINELKINFNTSPSLFILTSQKETSLCHILNSIRALFDIKMKIVDDRMLPDGLVHNNERFQNYLYIENDFHGIFISRSNPAYALISDDKDIQGFHSTNYAKLRRARVYSKGLQKIDLNLLDYHIPSDIQVQSSIQCSNSLE